MPRPKPHRAQAGTLQPAPSKQELKEEEARYRVEIGDRLRVAVEEIADLTKKSQAEIARQFHASPSELGNWLRGDHYPNPLWIRKFCHRYGVTTEWIYRGIPSGMAVSLADALEKSALALAAEKSVAGRQEGEIE